MDERAYISASNCFRLLLLAALEHLEILAPVFNAAAMLLTMARFQFFIMETLADRQGLWRFLCCCLALAPSCCLPPPFDMKRYFAVSPFMPPRAQMMPRVISRHITADMRDERRCSGEMPMSNKAQYRFGFGRDYGWRRAITAMRYEGCLFDAAAYHAAYR